MQTMQIRFADGFSQQPRKISDLYAHTAEQVKRSNAEWERYVMGIREANRYFINYFMPMSLNDYAYDYTSQYPEAWDYQSQQYFINHFMPIVVVDYHDEEDDVNEDVIYDYEADAEFIKGNPNINYEVDVVVEISFGPKHFYIPSSAGVHSYADAEAYIYDIIPGATIEDMRLSSQIDALPIHFQQQFEDEEQEVADIDELIANWDVHDQTLYGNDELDCVSKFVSKYRDDLKQHYYDGMTESQFLLNCIRDNIAVYNNDMFNLTLNAHKAKHSVICYNGHVLDNNKLISKHYTENILLDIATFAETYERIISNKENIVYDIRVYDGVFGKYLSSFCIDNKCYKLDFKNPMERFLDGLNDYACNFNHPAIKNCAVYSGKGNKYGYDLNAAYINALRAVKQIPIIDNIPITVRYYETHLKGHPAVVLVKEFVYNGIHFPPTMWDKDIADQYHMQYDNVYLIAQYKPFNYDVVIECIPTKNDASHECFSMSAEAKATTKYFKYELLDVPDKKYVEAIVRYALGSMIADAAGNEYRNVYTSYLDDILNPIYPHKYAEPKTENSIKINSLHNVYHAMKMEYYKTLLALIDEFHPTGIYCDCIYINQPMSNDDMLKHNLKLEYVYKPGQRGKDNKSNRDCNKSYNSDISTSNIRLVNGLAGFGKSYYVKNELYNTPASRSHAIVIVPESRLRNVWETADGGSRGGQGFKVYTFQYLYSTHKFPHADIIVDECYKFNTDCIDYLIGYAILHHVNLTLIGDRWQLEQVITDPAKARFIRRIYGMQCTKELTVNHRNNIDYRELIAPCRSNQLELRKQLFHKYLGKNIVKIDDFSDVNYCYRTTGDDATRDKADKLYQAYVKKLSPKDMINIRCTKNYSTRAGRSWYNGVIYQIRKQDLPNYPPSYFTVSNTYSVYATQGQTIDSNKLRLIEDDLPWYYNTSRMLYVLVSRLRLSHA